MNSSPSYRRRPERAHRRFRRRRRNHTPSPRPHEPKGQHVTAQEPAILPDKYSGNLSGMRRVEFFGSANRRGFDFHCWDGQSSKPSDNYVHVFAYCPNGENESRHPTNSDFSTNETVPNPSHIAQLNQLRSFSLDLLIILRL